MNLGSRDFIHILQNKRLKTDYLLSWETWLLSKAGRLGKNSAFDAK